MLLLVKIYHILCLPKQNFKLNNFTIFINFPLHFYHNLTGIFKGSWSGENITVPDNDISDKTLRMDNRGEFKFIGEGTFTLNIKSIKTKNDHINYIEGHLRLKDQEKSDSGALLLAEGFHFLNNGSIFLIGVPDGHLRNMTDVLHMLPTKESLEETQGLITEHIEKKINEIEQLGLHDSQFWEDIDDHPISVNFGCTMEIFAQLTPFPKNIKMSQIIEYEKELENPQGITTIQLPSMEISSTIYSPDCALQISIKDAEGLKIEEYFVKATNYATMATVIAISQIFLLIHQMEFTPTPSSVSNVSYWTIAMQSMMDGYICLLHLTTGVVMESVFLPFASAAFFSFISVSIFGMRYLLVIWKIQRPEVSRGNQAATRTADNTNTNTTNNTTNTTNNNSNNNNNNNSTTQPTSSQSHMDFSKIYIILLFGLFLFYQSTTRSAFIQNIVIGVLGFGLYSFWIPQIIRNVIRGCRKPLSPRYILGMTISRLTIPLYFYACPQNIIGQDPSFGVWALVGYMMLQTLVLFFQDLFGPRFFVPEKYLPQTYNYHPILPPEDEETIPDNSIKTTQPKDCAICMLPVDTSGTAATGLHVIGRTQYMMTPCHHLFHTDCLEKWMRIKLECPVCRSYLPSS
ncbi:unnamed protein product [Cunninghamella echinulata]